jgi:hypothetical protein
MDGTHLQLVTLVRIGQAVMDGRSHFVMVYENHQKVWEAFQCSPEDKSVALALATAQKGDALLLRFDVTGQAPRLIEVTNESAGIRAASESLFYGGKLLC